MLRSSDVGAAAGTASSAADVLAAGEDLAIKYLEFCVNELKLKVCQHIQQIPGVLRSPA